MIYLYVKQHAVTGLKYFGKTTYYDPYKYLGSGKYWKKHIRKHGTEHVQTLDVWAFDDVQTCSTFAIKYSEDNNIVESELWANLCIENGMDGAVGEKYFLGRRHTDETKAKMSASRKAIHESRKGWRDGANNPNYGRKQSAEARAKMSANRPKGPSGKKWFNNGVMEMCIHPADKPDGYLSGRLKR